MEQEQTASPEQQSSNEQTLEQVYQEFKVDDVAQQFQPQIQQQAPQQQPQYAAPVVPDPVLDPNGFKAHIGRLEAAPNLSRMALHEIAQLKQSISRQQEEADIKTAVAKVKEKLGGDVDDDFVEVALGQKARKDSKFASLYANRGRNPQAWNAALAAVGNELKGKYQFRADSQLTENIRAAKQSTQSSLTTKEESGNSLDKRFEGKSGRDFDQEWARLIHGGM